MTVRAAIRETAAIRSTPAPHGGGSIGSIFMIDSSTIDDFVVARFDVDRV